MVGRFGLVAGLVIASTLVGCSGGGANSLRSKLAKKFSSQPVREEDIPMEPYDKTPTPKMLCDIGDVELMAKRYNKAEDLYRKSLARDVEYAAGHVGLCKVNIAKNNVERAIATAQEGLKHCPQSAALLNELGVAYALSGNLPAAQVELQKAVQLEPRNRLFVSNLAGVLASRGDYQQSYELYTTIYTAAEAHYRVAGVLQSHGKFGESEGRLRMALSTDPNFGPAQAALEKHFDPEVKPAGFQLSQ